MNVAIIGASPKPDRYANKAMHKLTEAGHSVYLVHHIHKEIEGHPVFASLKDITVQIDTITVYINATKSNEIMDEIIAAAPKRIILNPGAENDKLQRAAESKGIKVKHACTLVMLATNTFLEKL